MYEKLLSRQQKSQIWTLRHASPSLSASSHRHIGNPSPIHRPLPRPKPTKRLRSSPNSPKPDGKVNTLLSLSPPNRLLLLAQRNTLAKKRSVLRVKKNITTVPVSKNSSTKNTLLSVKTPDGMSDFTCHFTARAMARFLYCFFWSMARGHGTVSRSWSERVWLSISMTVGLPVFPFVFALISLGDVKTRPQSKHRWAKTIRCP